MAGVLEEHRSYLQLPGRSASYRRALRRVVQPGDVVADLGCGIGVLGLFALEAGAGHVYGVDSSDAAELAREAMQRAAMADRYTVLRGSSFEVTLPEPVDLLLCDHVGFFGVDYGIVPMLADARERFLKPGGRIMPERIDLFVAGLSSPKAAGLIEAWRDPELPEPLHNLRGYAVNTRHGVDLTGADLCTGSQACGSVDLTRTAAPHMVLSAELTAKRDCRFDGIAGWFSCQLTEGAAMTNDPADPASIARSQAFLPAETPFDVREGDTIGIEIGLRTDGDHLTWTITPPAGAVQTMSSWKGTILHSHDLALQSGAAIAPGRQGRMVAVVLAAMDGSSALDAILARMQRDHCDLFASEGDLVRQVERTVRWLSS